VGLLWNGFSNGNYHNPGYTCPIVFLASTPSGSGSVIGAAWAWPNAIGTADDPAYETIGPGVFRFEYYYLLKDGHLSQNPFINKADPTAPHYRDVNGLNDVEAMVVSIAVIDSRSRSLFTDQNILDLAAQMYDFNTVNQHLPPNQTYVQANNVETQWNSVITADVSSGAMPAAAISAIRVYTRYFDLNNL
jgi:hypothetical protein